MKLVLCTSDADFEFVELLRALCCLFGYVAPFLGYPFLSSSCCCFERCVVFFGYVATFLYRCRQLEPLLYSVGNIRTRHDVEVTENC